MRVLVNRPAPAPPPEVFIRMTAFEARALREFIFVGHWPSEYQGKDVPAALNELGQKLSEAGIIPFTE